MPPLAHHSKAREDLYLFTTQDQVQKDLVYATGDQHLRQHILDSAVIMSASSLGGFGLTRTTIESSELDSSDGWRQGSTGTYNFGQRAS
jgi:hypothetical protein